MSDDKDSNDNDNTPETPENDEKVVTGKRFEVIEGGNGGTPEDPSNDNTPDDRKKDKLSDKFNTKDPLSGKIVVIGTIFAAVALGMTAYIWSSRKPAP